MEIKQGKNINSTYINKNRPLISIIVPIYNNEKYIDKCILSIINQIYTNLQIILIDDGSQDNSGNICDKYAKYDNRIQVIHKKNTGVADTRNIGIGMAEGEYIGFVDSDDYISLKMYEYLYNLIITKNADLSICNVYNVIGDKNIIQNKQNGIQIYNKIDILKEIIMDRNVQSYPVNKLYKRELLKDIVYPVGKNYEDIATTFHIIEKCNKVVVSDKPLYYYLKREDSIVSTIKEETIKDYINIIIERFLYIEQYYSDLKIVNIYYLAKTLITAHNDINNLSNPSKEIKKELNTLFKLTQKYMKDYGNEVDSLFIKNQKTQLDKIMALY